MEKYKEMVVKQEALLKKIKACRCRLIWADFWNKLFLALMAGGVAGIVFQAVSLLTPLYYVNVYTLAALVAAVASAMFRVYRCRCSMERTALIMDSFGFGERIVTAYENLHKEGNVYDLQREDAIRCLAEKEACIKIPLFPTGKKMLMTFGVLAVMLVLVWVPSPIRNQAQELHKIQKQAKEKEAEIREVLDELQKLEQQELTENQQSALQRMMESLMSSMEEYQQVSTEESLRAAGEKLNYKYGEMRGELESLAQALKNGASASAMTAQAMEQMADKMEQMADKMEQMSNSTQMAANQGNGTEAQGKDVEENNGQDSQGNAAGQSAGFNQKEGGAGSGQDGKGSVSGQGNGSDGQKNGGSLEGSGNGTGAGRGTGSRELDRNYVSVPNGIAEMGNLSGNALNHENSDFFRAPNGLNWEGVSVPYESVIGSYEQNAYEGIAAGRYPDGMENIIKEYFAGFN